MRTACAFLSFLAVAAPSRALDVQIKDVHAVASVMRTTIEIRDLVPDRFKKTLDTGGVLHLRLQTEFWESRPVWDRLVYPVITHVLRLARAGAGGLMSITDATGSLPSYAETPNPLPIVLDLGNRDRVSPSQKYYVHVIATLGTLAEREADAAGDAVFGKESETNGLGSLGRLVFRTALQISDYLQSVTAETRTRKIAGSDLLK